MILGVGCDIAEIARIRELWERNAEGFASKVFTEAEIAYAQSKKDSATHLAARFAAKEAALKALGTGWAEGLALHQVEIERSEDGRPTIVLHGKARERADHLGVSETWVSLSHDGGNAMAVVVLEGASRETKNPANS